jgi:hypothetical protein
MVKDLQGKLVVGNRQLAKIRIPNLEIRPVSAVAETNRLEFKSKKFKTWNCPVAELVEALYPKKGDNMLVSFAK